MENPDGFFERFDKAPKFKRVVPMMRFKGNERPEVTILANKIRWKTVHWTGSRSLPCTGEETTCPGCLGEHPKRLYGYIPVVNGSKGIQILQVTHVCGNAIEALLADFQSFRGIRIRIMRKGDKLQGEMKVEYITELSEKSGLPKDVDPMPTLMRLWGLDEQA